MSAGSFDHGDLEYWSITQGKVRMSYNITADTPGAVRRIITDKESGKSSERFEIVADYMQGYLTEMKVEYKEAINSKVVELTFYDVNTGQKSMVTFAKNSGYASKFFNILPNIDLKLPIRLVPYSFEKDGKKIIGTNVYQPDESFDFKTKIPPKWTKDAPGEMPVYPGKKDERKLALWKIDIDDFFMKYFNVIAQNIPVEPWDITNELQNRASSNKGDIPPPPIPPEDEGEDDDLPF